MSYAPPPLISPTKPLVSSYALSSAAVIAAPASGTWPVANRATYIPHVLSVPVLVRRLWVVNGTAVSGNVDVGIYTAAGARVVSAGSTAQAGTSSIQFFDVTDTYLAPGPYYLAVALSSTTATVFRGVAPGTLDLARVVGILHQASALPLPATATFTAIAASPEFPLIGFATTASP